MRLKPRPTLVILLSSIIISSVLALTIFGFYAYLEWKEKNIRRNYRLALYGLNAKLFRREVSANVLAKIERAGKFRGKPVVLGTIKNASNKTIYSLKLKASFYDEKGVLFYSDTFYPIGADFEAIVDIGDIAKTTKNFLQENDSVSFEHALKDCPPEVFNFLKSQSRLARVKEKKVLKFEYKVEGLDIR